MNKIVKKILKNICSSGFMRIIPDETYLKIAYKIKTGQKLDLKKTETFDAKLQWLKLYNKKPEYTQMVDKYEVRKYIKEKIGEEYLIPLLGVWDKFDDVEFDKLPNQFVLKCNHDSGGLVICTDKSKLDIKEAKKKIDKAMKINYFWVGREWAYKDVKPRIVAEKYMVDESGTELKDYKFSCFHGKVKFLQIFSNRGKTGDVKGDFFDIEFNHMQVRRVIPNSGKKISKPYNFEKMIELAEFLSKDIPFLRVDFYEVDKKIYFGELTFYPASGFRYFEPAEWNYTFGSYIDLK